MSHHEIEDLLEDYVDDRLDRRTRALVDDHLKTCNDCRAILDEVAPVDIASMGPSHFDERTMKRTVRRGLFRSAFNTIILLVAAYIVVWLVSGLLYQPLIVNRGDRAVAAARASIDVPTMINPGAVIGSGEIQTSLLHRAMKFEIVLPVGSGQHQFDPVAVSLGAASLIGEDQFSPWPYLIEADFSGTARDQLFHLGEGTVATVQLFFEQSVSVDEAQEIANSIEFDVRVIWAGFDTAETGQLPLSWAPGGTLGYATCVDPGAVNDDTLAANSAGFGRSVTDLPASIERAADAVRAALINLAQNPEMLDYISDGQQVSAVEAAADLLTSDPGVRTLVATGPSSELLALLNSFPDGDVTGQVLAGDFYNWTPGLCGR